MTKTLNAIAVLSSVFLLLMFSHWIAGPWLSSFVGAVLYTEITFNKKS